jgi:hypothetical protein
VPIIGKPVKESFNLRFVFRINNGLFIYRADNGQKLKEIFTGAAIWLHLSLVDGEQYVAVMAGYGEPFCLFPVSWVQFTVL